MKNIQIQETNNGWKVKMHNTRTDKEIICIDGDSVIELVSSFLNIEGTETVSPAELKEKIIEQDIQIIEKDAQIKELEIPISIIEQEKK